MLWDWWANVSEVHCISNVGWSVDPVKGAAATSLHVALSAQNWELVNGSFIRGEKRPWALAFYPCLMCKLTMHANHDFCVGGAKGREGEFTRIFPFTDFMIFLYFSFSSSFPKRMWTLLPFVWAIPFEVLCVPLQWQPIGPPFLTEAAGLLIGNPFMSISDLKKMVLWYISFISSTVDKLKINSTF